MSARARSGLVAQCVLVALAMAGCGGKSDKASSAGEPGAGGSSDSGAGAGSGRGALTEAECGRLLEHFLAVALAEKRATLPPEEVPTDEQVARILAQMRDALNQSCVGRTERSTYDCATMAETTRGLRTCLGERKEGE